MPTERPIVSDCNMESKNVSSFTDNYLKPFGYWLLITLDVESMYTDIDHTKGCKHSLTDYPIYDPDTEHL